MSRRAALAVILAVVGMAVAGGPGAAQPPNGQVTLTGRVNRAATYSIQDLLLLPAFQTQATSYGNRQSIFTGAMLWPLIVAARPMLDPTWGNNVSNVILARGADGTLAAVAMAEIDPEYEGKPLLVAYKQDGAMLPAPRLVVPGDRRAGRNLPNLVTIEVR